VIKIETSDTILVMEISTWLGWDSYVSNVSFEFFHFGDEQFL
jgi:hypothetical protein